MPLNSAPSSPIVSSKRCAPDFSGRNHIAAFFQTFRPNGKSVAVPVKQLHAIFSFVGEKVKMSGEGIQLQMVSHQRVQAVETAPHVTRAQAQIHPDARGQVYHPRTASKTIRNVAASPPSPMRNNSPLVSTSSRVKASARDSISGLVSSTANRTGCSVRSRFRQ